MGLTLPYERALNDSVTLHDGAGRAKHVGTDEIYVTPGYFDTLQIPLLQGRDFAGSDGPDRSRSSSSTGPSRTNSFTESIPLATRSTRAR